MATSKMWVFSMFIVSLSEITGSVQSECHISVLDAIAGETFTIGTWSLNNAPLSVTVKRGDTIRLNYLFDGNVTKLAQDREGRLVLKQDIVTTEVSIMFETVGREDEGQYGMETYFRRGQIDRYGRKDIEYKFQLNVIEQDEVIQGCEGDNILKELESTTESFFLYRYDKTIATVMKSGCWVSEEALVYGRLRCSSKNDTYRISINNATQLDSGLYKIQDPMNSIGIQRWFFNISDKPAHAIIGDNVVISWFYEQPGINCTIRVIHPYEGAILLVPPNNLAQIRSNVRHRLLYSGDVSRNYMSFTLLNVIATDAGFYRIESLYDTIIAGRKQLIVEVRNAAVNESTTQLGICISTSPSRTTESVSLSVPIYLFIPVIIVVAVVFNLIVYCLRRIWRKNTSDRPNEIPECDADAYITPISAERPLLVPLMTDKLLSQTNAPQNEEFDSSLLLLHRTPSLCMDGYEMVDIPSKHVHQIKFNNEEIIYESTETNNTDSQDTSGYLTVC